MPNFSEMVYSKYLSKADLASPLILHIRAIAFESTGGGGGGGRGGGGRDEQKWVMYFNEHAKGLRLNNTIIRYLESVLGPNSDAAIGKKCRVFVDPTVQMAGQVVGGVRLEIARSQLGPPPGQWGAPPPAAAPPYQPPPPPTQRWDEARAAAAPPVPAPRAATDPDFDDDIPF